jgi:GR25 family glycosyltransferase involved in LPS biosynthesis
MEGLQNPDMCDIPAHGQPPPDIGPDERAAAKAWADENLAVFVVNLPAATERWTNAQFRWRAEGVEPNHIDGINLVAIGIDGAKERGLIPKSFDYENAKEVYAKQMTNHSTAPKDWTYWRELDSVGMGSLGCSVAHLNAQHEAAGRAEQLGKPLVLIAEDDVSLGKDFLVRLRRLVFGEVPCDWEAISLSSRCSYGFCVSPHLARIQPDGNEPYERCYQSTSYGLYGTLYRAERLRAVNDRLRNNVFDPARPGCLPTDVSRSGISAEMVFYGIPASQAPGLVWETQTSHFGQGSDRWALNHPESFHGKIVSS